VVTNFLLFKKKKKKKKKKKEKRKKKERSSQQMVSEQLALGYVRKVDKRKLRVVLESKDNKRAVGS
jgi:hypothetical protein